jgi:hypothetical protein
VHQRRRRLPLRGELGEQRLDDGAAQGPVLVLDQPREGDRHLRPDAARRARVGQHREQARDLALARRRHGVRVERGAAGLERDVTQRDDARDAQVLARAVVVVEGLHEVVHAVRALALPARALADEPQPVRGEGPHAQGHAPAPQELATGAAVVDQLGQVARGLGAAEHAERDRRRLAHVLVAVGQERAQRRDDPVALWRPRVADAGQRHQGGHLELVVALVLEHRGQGVRDHAVALVGARSHARAGRAPARHDAAVEDPREARQEPVAVQRPPVGPRGGVAGGRARAVRAGAAGADRVEARPVAGAGRVVLERRRARGREGRERGAGEEEVRGSGHGDGLRESGPATIPHEARGRRKVEAAGGAARPREGPVQRFASCSSCCR